MDNKTFQIFLDLLTQNNLPKVSLFDMSIKQVISFAAALQHNTSLKELELINLSDAGMKYIAEALKTNQTLESLKVRGRGTVHFGVDQRSVGKKGAKYIADTLKINSTLTSLVINNGKIDNEGVQYIADMLKDNKSLTELYLGDNKIGDDGALAILNSLQLNTSLVRLGLSDNKISSKVANKFISEQYSNRIIFLNGNNGSTGFYFGKFARLVGETYTGILAAPIVGPLVVKHGIKTLRERYKEKQHLKFFGGSENVQTVTINTPSANISGKEETPLLGQRKH